MGQLHARSSHERLLGGEKRSSVGRIIRNRLFPSEITFSFVFDNYTWSTSDAEAVRFGLSINPLNKKLIPSRIPFTAIITG
jgi:hypothetical protein